MAGAEGDGVPESAGGALVAARTQHQGAPGVRPSKGQLGQDEPASG